jgi:tetratricopeptide (TPR) repeat protein
MGNIPEARQQFAAIANGDYIAGRWKGTLSLGSVHTMYGEYREAMARFDEAATILEDAEATGALTQKDAAIGLLYVNGNRTNVYLNGGDFEGARPLILKCLETAEAYGIADEHLEARFDLAWCDFNTGRWSAAYRGLSSMLQLAKFVGDQARQTMARAWLGILLAAAGDFQSALSYGKDALSLALSRGDRRGELYAQLALADAYTGQTKRESEARYHTNQAMAVAASLKMDRGEAECRLRVARLNAQLGDFRELTDAAARAQQLAEKLGARHLESLALCWLAAAAHRDVDSASALGADAKQLSEQALSLAETIGLAEGKWRAHSIIASVVESNGATAGNSEAISQLKAAAVVLDGLRAELVDAGIADTLLEDEECLEVYAELIRRIRGTGNTAAADTLLEQVGWLPLELRLSSEPPGEQRQS